jgi:hypothetical protein
MTSSALRASFSAFLIFFAGCAATSDDDFESSEGAVKVDPAKRDAAARSAKIWDEAEFDKLASKDLVQGPDYPGAPRVGSEIVCRFVEPRELKPEDLPGGNTPKFLCNPVEPKPADAARAPITEQMKIKYSGVGRLTTETDPKKLDEFRRKDADGNGEVFAEPAATRLLWALGFYADGVYPVKVRCYGCPENPHDAYKMPSDPRAGGDRKDRDFFFGAAEIKAPGKKIEKAKDSGFHWKEDVPFIDPKRSAKDVVDGWKLFAALTYHSDNKHQQQRLFCPKESLAEDGTCSDARAMIQDIGTSFGSKKSFPSFSYNKADFNAWREQDLWKAPLADGACKANLAIHSTGDLGDPDISQAGREWLLEKLGAISHEQLTAIFTASRIAERGDKVDDRLVTVEDWVNLFEHKVKQMANANCSNVVAD